MSMPTMGQMVHYWTGERDYRLANLDHSQPMLALVCFVKNRPWVCLSVTDHMGNQWSKPDVTFRSPGEDRPSAGIAFCEPIPRKILMWTEDTSALMNQPNLPDRGWANVQLEDSRLDARLGIERSFDCRVILVRNSNPFCVTPGTRQNFPAGKFGCWAEMSRSQDDYAWDGFVDPYLNIPVNTGDLFWLYLNPDKYPNGLREPDDLACGEQS